MKSLPPVIASRLYGIVSKFNKEEEPVVIVPNLNEDLSDLSEHDIRNEISVINRRLELKLYEPEGESGLNYRLHRLMAQQKVLEKKGKK